MVASPTATRSPYKGLIPFSEEDAPFFFGRGKESQLIVANLFASPLTLLYGASGVGKSSVLQAGVAPQLRRREDVLLIEFNTWQGDAILDLKATINRASLGIAAGAESSFPLSLTEYLVRCCQQLDRRVMVVLDQFEEYFLYRSSDDRFAEEFPGAILQSAAPISFLISIREDALSKLDLFEGRVPNLFDNYLRIDHLSEEAAHSAIKKPIAKFNKIYSLDNGGFSIEPELVEAVSKQVQMGQVVLGETGRGVVKDTASEVRVETPYLQLVMLRLWDQEVSVGSRTLRLKTLTDLGGAAKIVSTHVDDTMKTFSASEQAVAANLLHYLVTSSGSKIAHTVSDLSDYTELAPAKLSDVLHKLASGKMRILRVVPASRSRLGEARYEIFHDALAPALLVWRAAFLREQKEIESQRELALEKQQRTKAEDKFFVQQFRADNLFIILLVVGLFALGLLGYVAWTALVKAKAQESISRSRFLAARAARQLYVDPELSMILAREAVAEARTEEAEDALREAISQSQILITLNVGQPLRSARFSQDGKYLITIPRAAAPARVWDAQTGQFIRSLDETKNATAASFSPTGKFVVIATLDNFAEVWETNTWTRTGVRLEGHSDVVNSASFSPDGKYILTASQDKTARIWYALTGKSKKILSGHTDSVSAAAFSADGKYLVTASYDQTLTLRTADTGKIVRKINNLDSGVLFDAAFSPDSKYIVCGGEYNAVVLEVATGEKVADLPQRNSRTYSAEFSPNGKYIVTATDHNLANLWETGTWQAIANLKGHRDQIISAAFSLDSQKIVTASSDGTARVWETSSTPILLDLRGHDAGVNSAAFSPDGQFIVSASSDKTARVWDAKTGQSICVFRSHEGAVFSAVFSPDGKYVVSTSEDRTARVWDAFSCKPVRSLAGHTDYTIDAQFSRDGEYIITASWDGSAILWATATGEKIQTFSKDNHRSYSAVFSPDDRYIVIARSEGLVEVWERNSDTSGPTANYNYLTHLEIDNRSSVYEVMFSHDAKHIVTAGADNYARLWEVGTWKPQHTLAQHQEQVNGAAFSPNNEYVVTASQDMTAWIWEVAKGRRLLGLYEFGNSIKTADFSPDGTSIVTASDDNRVVVQKYDLAVASVDELLALVDKRARRLTQEEQDTNIPWRRKEHPSLEPKFPRPAL